MAAEDSEFVLLNASDVEGLNDSLLPLPIEIIDELQEWLAPTDYTAASSEYGKHRASHLAGTGLWLQETIEYQQWHDGDVGALWIKAVAGAGKSVVAASVASKLMAEEQVPVLYFFFRQIVSANQKPKSLVRDYLSQLLPHSPQLQHDLEHFIRQRSSLDATSFDDLWKLFISASLAFPRIYCVVDALDEMDLGNETFLGALVGLGQKNPAGIKLLMTSRPVSRVEQPLQHPSILQIVLQPKFVSPDISLYVKHRTNELSVSDDVRLHVHEVMSAKADGHFLYARLMMDDLVKTFTASSSKEKDLLIALKRLPAPMADMYTKMLDDHSRQSQVPRDLQVVLLQWVTRAERPLRLLELASWVNTETLAPEVFKDSKLVVREACGPLLEVLEDGTVCPIHHSFTEYLYDPARIHIEQLENNFPRLQYEETHRHLGLACVRFLRSGWHRDWKFAETREDWPGAERQQQLKRFMLQYPFLEYAAKNWYKHLRRTNSRDDNVNVEVYALLETESNALQAWLEFIEFATESNLRVLPASIQDYIPLHIAADRGLSEVVQYMVKQGHDINRVDPNDRTAVTYAAASGHDKVVKILIELGAKINEADEQGFTPLHHAAQRGHHTCVSILIEAGVDPFTPKTKESFNKKFNAPTIGEVPLQYACRNGHMDTVKAYLPYLKDDYVYQALHWAWAGNHSKVATMLLQTTHVNVNHVHDDQTLLYSASCVGDVKSMKLLLESGADASIISSSHVERFRRRVPDRRRQNALHGMLSRSSPTTARLSLDKFEAGLELLLGAGIDINAKDSCGMTILHYLLQNNDCKIRNIAEKEKFLFILLEKGSDAAVLTRSGQNAFHFVNSMFTEAVVDALLAHGATIDCLDHGRTSPLFKALKSHRISIAQFLVERGASPRLPDRDGNTPLHAVVERAQHLDQERFLQLAKVLIAHGADVNARNQHGDTPLHLRILPPAMLDLFLEHGFNLEAKNRRGQTALFCVSSREHSQQYAKLIDAGADPCSRDAAGRTILHHILSSHSLGIPEKLIERLQFFVEKGVDPHLVDSVGDTLWHTLSRRGTHLHGADLLPLAKYLAKLGVAANTQNHAGRVPFHHAVLMTTDEPLQHSLIGYLLNQISAHIDAMDHDRIRPIHLTASRNMELTSCLLKSGADLSAATLEGQTPLMIASRMRQSDIVCLLLDWHQERDQLHLLNEVDLRGRSALHYACRSGRPESVALLLDAGANANLEDKVGLTPLCTCAEYLEEQKHWTSSGNKPFNNQDSEFAYILLDEPSRPVLGANQNDFPRVRETIRLLVEKGANVEFLIEKPNKRSSAKNPLSIAIKNRCQAMVEELLDLKRRIQSPQPTSSLGSHQTDPRLSLNDLAKFSDRIRLFKTTDLSAITTERMKRAQDCLDLVTELLDEDNEPAIKQLPKLGFSFITLNESNEYPMELMVKRGFTDLMRCVGQDAAEMTAAWAVTKTDGHHTSASSILATALGRQTPNLSMIKLLISEHHVDVNEKCSCMKAESVVCRPAIHKIARVSRWWHLRALEYIITQVHDIDMVDCGGATALMIALKDTAYRRGEAEMRYRAAKMLLEHGANPNAVDKSGLTCLNHAAGRQDCFDLLLEHGANPLLGARPVMLDLVESRNIQGLRRILAAQVDVNKKFDDSQDHSYQAHAHYRANFPTLNSSNSQIQLSHAMQPRVLMQNAYVLHAAAAHFMNRGGTGTSIRRQAIEMIEMLLDSGANPFLTYKNGIPILHTLAEQGGILEPFLKRKDLDLESKDHLGRTLLLAACDCKASTFKVKTSTAPLLLMECGSSLEAKDNEGRNALQCLMSAERQENDHPPAIMSMPDVFFTTLVPKVDLRNRNALHYALSHKRFECIDKLLSFGADPSISDPLDDSTALHYIAQGLSDYTEIILWKPTLHFSDDDEVYPDESEQDMSSPDDRRRQWLTNHNTKLAHMYPTLEKVHELELRSPSRHFNNLLTKYGLDINARDNKGETPLLKFAAADPSGQELASPKVSLTRVLDMFDKAGADFTVRNNNGESVLHKLAMHKSRRAIPVLDAASDDLRDCASWLLKKDVKASWEDTSGRTCLDIAAVSGAQWLLDIYKRD